MKNIISTPSPKLKIRRKSAKSGPNSLRKNLSLQPIRNSIVRRKSLKTITLKSLKRKPKKNKNTSKTQRTKVP